MYRDSLALHYKKPLLCLSSSYVIVTDVRCYSAFSMLLIIILGAWLELADPNIYSEENEFQTFTSMYQEYLHI